VADIRQHLQRSARNQCLCSLAIALWWRNRVSLAQHDRHRLPQRGQLFGRECLHDCRCQQEYRAHAGNRARVVGVGDPWRQFGRAAAARRASIVCVAASCWGRQTPSSGCAVQKASSRCRSGVHRRPAARCSHRREPGHTQPFGSTCGPSTGSACTAASAARRSSARNQVSMLPGRVISWRRCCRDDRPRSPDSRPAPAPYPASPSCARCRRCHARAAGRQAITRDRRIHAARPTSNSGASGGPMVSAVSRLPACAGYQTV
jgi:hypothetical protein